MTNKKSLRYLPAIIYTLLPALLWIYSIAANIVSLLVNDSTAQAPPPSIDIRWFLSSSQESISNLPLGTIVLILISASMIYTSGLLSAVGHILRREMRSNRIRSALIAAAVTLMLTLALLIPATIYPWNLTAGITGEFAQSPLAHGWLILLSAIISATTTVFGIVAGTYRNIEDIIKGGSHLIATHAHSIAALIPAALFISMSDHLEYPLFAYPIAKYIFLLLPFLSDIYTNQKTTNK